jgi:hypothetical protein
LLVNTFTESGTSINCSLSRCAVTRISPSSIASVFVEVALAWASAGAGARQAAPPHACECQQMPPCCGDRRVAAIAILNQSSTLA